MRPQVQLPAWLERANSEIGVKEIVGPDDHPRILEYHDATTLDATDDETPWCSSFVNWCMWGVCDRTHSARARSWLKWGVKLEYPAVGCVVILKRGGGKQPGPEVTEAPGHVGFFMGYAGDGDVLLLGGNQSNQVCVTAYPASRVLGFRWAA